jgi:hypothetical protein
MITPQNIAGVSGQIATVFNSYNWALFFAIIKLVLEVITVLLAAGIVTVIVKHHKLTHPVIASAEPAESAPHFNAAPYQRAWEHIEAVHSSTDINILKLAIIDADKLLDEALGALGYEGDLGGKLQSITPDTLGSLDALWDAHKVRNNIVHAPNYVLSVDRAHYVLEEYKQGLIELGILSA